MNNVAIFGATSAIAQATARRLCGPGTSFFLAGRNAGHLEQIAADLLARGAAGAWMHATDLADTGGHAAAFAALGERFATVDVVLIAHGTLPRQEQVQDDFEATLAALQVNAISVISLLGRTATLMLKQGKGTIACISSVAGDRGRQSNYVYGTAKAAVSTYLQGLRNRLATKGVQVLTIKPGFVDTPMTADMPKGPLWAQPDAVARDIVAAIQRRKDVIYTPFFWRFVMLAIRAIPERLFKTLRL